MWSEVLIMSIDRQQIRWERYHKTISSDLMILSLPSINRLFCCSYFRRPQGCLLPTRYGPTVTDPTLNLSITK